MIPINCNVNNASMQKVQKTESIHYNEAVKKICLKALEKAQKTGCFFTKKHHLHFFAAGLNRGWLWPSDEEKLTRIYMTTLFSNELKALGTNPIHRVRFEKYHQYLSQHLYSLEVIKFTIKVFDVFFEPLFPRNDEYYASFIFVLGIFFQNEAKDLSEQDRERFFCGTWEILKKTPPTILFREATAILFISQLLKDPLNLSTFKELVSKRYQERDVEIMRDLYEFRHDLFEAPPKNPDHLLQEWNSKLNNMLTQEIVNKYLEEALAFLNTGQIGGVDVLFLAMERHHFTPPNAPLLCRQALLCSQLCDSDWMEYDIHLENIRKGLLTEEEKRRFAILYFSALIDLEFVNYFTPQQLEKLSAERELTPERLTELCAKLFGLRFGLQTAEKLDAREKQVEEFIDNLHPQDQSEARRLLSSVDINKSWFLVREIRKAVNTDSPSIQYLALKEMMKWPVETRVSRLQVVRNLCMFVREPKALKEVLTITSQSSLDYIKHFRDYLMQSDGPSLNLEEFGEQFQDVCALVKEIREWLLERNQPLEYAIMKEMMLFPIETRMYQFSLIRQIHRFIRGSYRPLHFVSLFKNCSPEQLWLFNVFLKGLESISLDIQQLSHLTEKFMAGHPQNANKNASVEFGTLLQEWNMHKSVPNLLSRAEEIVSRVGDLAHTPDVVRDSDPDFTRLSL